MLDTRSYFLYCEPCSLSIAPPIHFNLIFLIVSSRKLQSHLLRELRPDPLSVIFFYSSCVFHYSISLRFRVSICLIIVSISFAITFSIFVCHCSYSTSIHVLQLFLLICGYFHTITHFFPGELPVAVVSSWQFMFPPEVDTTLFLQFEIHQHRLANLFAADIALSYNNRNCFRTSCSSRQLTTSRYVSCRVVSRCFYISDGDAFPLSFWLF